MAEWLGRRTSVREYPGSSPGRDVVSKDLRQVLHLYLPPGWLGQVEYVERRPFLRSRTRCIENRACDRRPILEDVTDGILNNYHYL